ncbi:uncharacterized protein Dere_GG26840 [Drosophila erecta]|uniref:Uncharacterized protein n=1 Tax=Drosophila erecta TaxID=7220 RepID=A0A0Q5WIM5_DROER|nr:uncharacterized protein Dere_GG26840 [Drosophila erecta]
MVVYRFSNHGEKPKKQKAKKEKKSKVVVVSEPNVESAVPEAIVEPTVEVTFVEEPVVEVTTIVEEVPPEIQQEPTPVSEEVPSQPLSWSSIVSQTTEVTTNITETRLTEQPEDQKPLEEKPKKQKAKKEKKSKVVVAPEPIVESAVPEAIVEPTVEVTFVQEPVVEEVTPETESEPTPVSEEVQSQPLSWSSVVSQTTEVTTNITETRLTEQPEDQKPLEEKPKKQKAKKEKKSKVVLVSEPNVEPAVPEAIVEPTVEVTTVEEPVVEVTKVVDKVTPEIQPEPTPVSEEVPTQPPSWSSIVSQATEVTTNVTETHMTDEAKDQKPVMEKPKKQKTKKEKKTKVHSVEELMESNIPVSVAEPLVGLSIVQEDVAPKTETHTLSWSSIVAQSVGVPQAIPMHVESKSGDIQNFIAQEQNFSTVVNDTAKNLKPKKEKKIVQPIQQPTAEIVSVPNVHMRQRETDAVPEPQTLSWSSIVSHNIDLTPTFTENRVIETVDEIVRPADVQDSIPQESELPVHIPETECVSRSSTPEFNIQLPAPTKPSVWSSLDTYAEVVKKSGYTNNTNIKYQKIETSEPIKSEPKHLNDEVQTHEDLLEFPDPILPAIEGDEPHDYIEKPSQLSWKDLVDEDDVVESWYKEEPASVETKPQEPVQERHSRVSVKPQIRITEVVTENQLQSETDQEFLEITSKKRNRSRSRSQQSQTSNFDEKPQKKKSKKPKNKVPKAPTQQPTETPEDVQPPKETPPIMCQNLFNIFDPFKLSPNQLSLKM